MIGNNIKKLRLAKNWTQKDLAIKSNITRESIGNYERGDRIPPSDILNKIATALQVPISDLIDNKDTDLISLNKATDNTFEDMDFLNDIPDMLKPLSKLIIRCGYEVIYEYNSNKSIISILKDNDIIAKVPEEDFIDLGKVILSHIKEFEEFEITKLIDMYKLLG